LTDDRPIPGCAPHVLLIVASLVFALGPTGSALAGSGNGNGNGNVGNGNGNGNSGNDNGNGNVGNDNGNGNTGSGNGNGYRSDGNGNGAPNAEPNSSGQTLSCCAADESDGWSRAPVSIRQQQRKETRTLLLFPTFRRDRR